MIADRILAVLGCLFGAAGIVLMALAAHGRWPEINYAAVMVLAHAPVLLGTQVTTYEDGTQSRFDPERGQQIDGNVRYVHHVGPHMDAVLGVRYVNFTASYDRPGHPLSDRNAAVLPAFGYLWHL